ncbi:MAG: lactate racemase domain-containing protein [Thermodesulfobacteriota bacterium]
MKQYVNYEGSKLYFSLPSGWRSIANEDRAPAPGTAEPVKEIQHALDHPHPIAGFGGGSKIIMPGVCSYRSTADHHFTWMRNRNSRVNVLNGNPFYEDSVDAARIARLAFKLDLIINEKKEVVRAFAGDPLEEHKQAARYAGNGGFFFLV